MKLLPTEQTAAQLAALRKFLDNGALTLCEPCNCDGRVRHNNGGNYHDVWEFKADGGQFFERLGTTSEYDNAEWKDEALSTILDRIAEASANGYR